jgi:hypothetical protein
VLTFIYKKYAHVILPLISQAICDFTPKSRIGHLYCILTMVRFGQINLAQFAIILN